MPSVELPTHQGYDLIVVGTGFAGSFFLKGYLQTAPKTARVLVLERGAFLSQEQRIAERRQRPWIPKDAFTRAGKDDYKNWMFSVAFGGGSNCWWANTPRFMPADFQTKTRFGVGRDWPFTYEDLAPYYDVAERVMSTSGPEGPWPFPRSGPYPQPPHRLNKPDELLKAAYPDLFFNAPTGRARNSDAGRGVCCGNGVCYLCPQDAKFTIENGLMSPYQDPRVDLVLEARVTAVDIAAGVAHGVTFVKGGRDHAASGDLVMLGCNAVYNPGLLGVSGVQHPLLGKRIHEQVGLVAEVRLRGLDSFQGSTSITGHGYWLYADEQRRKTMAGCLIETWNIGDLRSDFGRWQQVLHLRLVYEVIPLEQNFVGVGPGDLEKPVITYDGFDDYTGKAIRQARSDLERIMAPLPVEEIVVHNRIEPTEAHVLGTTVMGVDPAQSVVDPDGLVHGVRNLIVLGGSTYPVSGPANPSLTIAAQALRSADRLMGTRANA